MRPPVQPPECPTGWATAPPDFVGVGAQRCGTTWWDALVADHPGVCRLDSAPKELHFFDRFVRAPVTDTLSAEYARHFPRPPGQLAGEWTPRYMLDFWTPRLLAGCAPDARLIVCLRDPVERYRSGIATHVESARVRGQRMNPMASANHVLRSLYHLQLRRVLAHFPREQVLVLQFEACLEDPARELRRTYRFLGLQPGHRPAALDRQTNASPADAKPQLGAGAHADLVAVLRDDVRALAADFPEIDLGHWPAFAALA